MSAREHDDATPLSGSRLQLRRADMPGAGTLALRGPILILGTENWVGSSTLFVPAAWVNVRMIHRRPWRAFFPRALAGLLFVAMGAAAWLPETALPPGWRWLLHGAAACGMLLVLAALVAPGLRARPVLELSIPRRPRRRVVRFWAEHPDPGALSALIAGLDALHGRVGPDDAPRPVALQHAWQHARPYRVALLRGALLALVGLALLLWIDVFQTLRQAAPVPGLAYGLLIFPLAYALGRVLWRQGRRWSEPRAFRQALAAYQRGDHTAATDHLEVLLDMAPDHAAGRFMMVQACAERFDFDSAFRHCDALAKDHPAAAARLQANLWGLKRMHDQMNPDEPAEAQTP